MNVNDQKLMPFNYCLYLYMYITDMFNDGILMQLNLLMKLTLSFCL